MPEPGHYFLDLTAPPGELPYLDVRLTAAGGESLFAMLPAASRTRYLVRTRRPDASIVFRDPHVTASVRPLGWGNLGNLGRWRPKDLRLRYVFGNGISILPLLRGAGSESRKISRAAGLLKRWGFGPLSANLQESPAIFDPVPVSRPQSRAVDARVPRFAVVLHLFFGDLWPEFEAVLAGIAQPFQLIVTLTGDAESLDDRIRASFPSAEIFHLPNRGRDVGPFVHLLSEGRLDRFDLICKIHGKRSGSTVPKRLHGHVWRRTMVFDTIGSTEQVEAILRRFAEDPSVGMIGSARFRMPSPGAHKRAWGKNMESTLALARRMDIGPEKFALEFFAGTMFWVRRQALEPIRRLGLRIEDFPEEDGAFDGAIHHALERLFGVAVLRGGMKLENAPLRYTQRHWA